MHLLCCPLTWSLRASHLHRTVDILRRSRAHRSVCIGRSTRALHTSSMADNDTETGCCRAKVAREARFATQDAKRRKMREDLEKRERTVAAARDEEAAARAKLKVRMCIAHVHAALGRLPPSWFQVSLLRCPPKTV